MSLVLGHVNTGRYDFVVVAEDEGQAKARLIDAANRHANQLDPERDWLDRQLLRKNVREWWEFTTIEIGEVLRDGSPIK